MLGLIVQEDQVFVRDDVRRHGYVSDLVVDEAWRGKGIGRLLIGEAERLTREKGLKRLVIGVMAGNDGAERLYGELGFSVYAKAMMKPLLSLFGAAQRKIDAIPPWTRRQAFARDPVAALERRRALVALDGVLAVALLLEGDPAPGPGVGVAVFGVDRGVQVLDRLVVLAGRDEALAACRIGRGRRRGCGRWRRRNRESRRGGRPGAGARGRGRGRPPPPPG